MPDFIHVEMTHALITNMWSVWFSIALMLVLFTVFRMELLQKSCCCCCSAVMVIEKGVLVIA